MLQVHMANRIHVRYRVFAVRDLLSYVNKWGVLIVSVQLYQLTFFSFNQLRRYMYSSFIKHCIFIAEIIDMYLFTIYINARVSTHKVITVNTYELLAS